MHTLKVPHGHATAAFLHRASDVFRSFSTVLKVHYNPERELEARNLILMVLATEFINMRMLYLLFTARLVEQRMEGRLGLRLCRTQKRWLSATIDTAISPR